MRYSASEKFEIIELVEQSSLSIRRTLAPIGIPRSTFYDWYSRYQEGGIEALEDGKPRPRRIWNKIPDKIRTAIVNLALEESDLSPRELAVNFTDTNGSFVSEASVYRLLKDHGLITSPAFILMKAADRFADPTTAPNQLWQTDFTYLKVIGWGWFYLSTVLDDFSRYILAWKLCTTMAATDVSDTLQAALQASGLDQVKVLHRPRLLSDNGPSYVASELGQWLEDKGIRHIRGRPLPPDDAGQDRAVSSLDEKPDPAGKLLSARTARTEHRRVRRVLQQLPVPREPGQPNTGRRLLRQRTAHTQTEGNHQTKDHRTKTPPASAGNRSLNLQTR